MFGRGLGPEAKSAVAFTLASVFSRGLALVSLPIFTRIMTPADIGVVNLYSSWYSLLAIVSTLALTSGGYSLAMKEFAGERDQYESSVLTVTSLMAVLIGCVFLVNPVYWSELLDLSPALISLLIVGLFFGPAWEFWITRQRFEYKYRLAFPISVLSAIVATGLSVIAVLRPDSTPFHMLNVAEARLVANYAVVYGLAACFWLLLMLKGRTLFSWRFWKYSLTLSLPLIGYSISTQVLNVSDRVMITNMVGDEATGIYGTLYTASAVPLIVWSAINASFIPYLFQNVDTPGHQGIRRTSAALLGAFASISVAISWMAPEIVQLLATDEYLSAISVMPPIAAGVFLTAVSNMYSNILVYYKRTRYIMFAAMAAAIVNVALNLLLIPRVGYEAAAYSTLIGYVVLAGSQYLWSRKTGREMARAEAPYDDRVVFSISIATVAASMLGLILYQFAFARYAICLAAFIVGVLIWNRFRGNRG